MASKHAKFIEFAGSCDEAAEVVGDIVSDIVDCRRKLAGCSECTGLLVLPSPMVPPSDDNDADGAGAPSGCSAIVLMTPEIVGCSIYDLFSGAVLLRKPSGTAALARSLVRAIGALHRAKIFHGNIKSTNIFVDATSGSLMFTDPTQISASRVRSVDHTPLLYAPARDRMLSYVRAAVHDTDPDFAKEASDAVESLAFLKTTPGFCTIEAGVQTLCAKGGLPSLPAADWSGVGLVVAAAASGKPVTSGMGWADVLCAERGSLITSRLASMPHSVREFVALTQRADCSEATLLKSQLCAKVRRDDKRVLRECVAQFANRSTDETL